MLWIRKRRIPASTFFLLSAAAAGVLSLVLAAFVQSLLPENLREEPSSAFIAITDIFIRVSLTEETARTLILALLFSFITLRKKTPLFEGYAAASGLMCGLSFAALETAVYAAGGTDIVLLRAFTAAPLHGACGIRCGLAALNIKKTPLGACGRLASAIGLHTFYNFLLPNGGISSTIAVILAITALISSAAVINIKTP
jgi:RsiW-degrading membrane proteinase PrsW (M82 family)